MPLSLQIHGQAFMKQCCLCRASSGMHDEVVQHVMRAPLAFFHTNPTGRILNRFSKDQGTADDHLPQVAFDATQSLFLVAGTASLLNC